MGLKQLLTSNLEHETKYSYSPLCTGSMGMGKRVSMIINTLEADLLVNPIIIIEIDETFDLEFDTSNILDKISLEIGGTEIDRLYSNQLKIYQAKKGYEIKKIGSKIFYPLPFDSFDKDEGIMTSKCKLHEIRLWIEFGYNPHINNIKDMYVRTDAITIKTKPDYTKISKYYINDSKNKDGYESLKNYLDNDNCQIVKIKQNQFTGWEDLKTTGTNCKRSIYYNNLVEKIFIYFEDKTNDFNSIYKFKIFDKITFIADGCIIIEYDWESLVYDNDEKNIGYKLPNGVYQIDLEKFYSKNLSKVNKLVIEFSGLYAPDNTGFFICGNSINYLKYENNICELCFN
jgi:hypothetical protein